MTEVTVRTSVPAARQDRATPVYTAEEMLTTVLAAYERGLQDARAQQGRDRWNDAELIARFRQARIDTETAAMRRTADLRYVRRGLPGGYQYRGGAVDWETSLPAGSACAWLRRKRRPAAREAA